jgi:hypothetical protein
MIVEEEEEEEEVLAKRYPLNLQRISESVL